MNINMAITRPNYHIQALCKLLLSTVIHALLVLFIFTSAEEGGYVFGSVCLSVFLSVCLFVCLSVGLLANLWTDFDEIFWRGTAWLKDKWYNFGGDPDHASDPGVQKSEIRILRIGRGLCCLSALLFILIMKAESSKHELSNILNGSLQRYQRFCKNNYYHMCKNKWRNSLKCTIHTDVLLRVTLC